MTDFQHDCARDVPEQVEATTHDLSHSSQPIGSEPIFQPIAIAPSKTADEALEILAQECNELADREEAMHKARGALDTSPREYEAASKAIDPITEQLHFKWTTAALVWPDTYIGLAAKARIYHSMRHALVGCIVPEAQPLLESIAADVARLSGERPRELWAKDDAQLIRTVNEAARLSEENDAIWGAGPELKSDDPVQVAWQEQADAASARFTASIDLLAGMRAKTPAGLAAKASVATHLTRFHDEMRSTPEGDLMLGIAEDAQRICAGLPPYVQDDAALLTIGRHFEMQWRQERIVIARNDSDAAIKIEVDRSEDFVNRIRDLPATTPAGWHVKARAIAWTCGSDVSGECPVDVKVVASLLRDLGALEGGSPSAPKLLDPDQYLLAHHAPFHAAWKAEREAAALHDTTTQSREADASHDQLIDAMFAKTRNIASFPATSLDGLKLKAAALSALYPDEEITVECLTGLPGKATTDMKLILDIIRDLRAMVDEPVVSVLPQPGHAVETLEQAA